MQCYLKEFAALYPETFSKIRTKNKVYIEAIKKKHFNVIPLHQKQSDQHWLIEVYEDKLFINK